MVRAMSGKESINLPTKGTSKASRNKTKAMVASLGIGLAKMVAPNDTMQFHDAMVVGGQKTLHLESVSNPPIASTCQNKLSVQRCQNEAALD